MNGFIFKHLWDIALATKKAFSFGVHLAAHFANDDPFLYGGKNGFVFFIGLKLLKIGLPCINGAVLELDASFIPWLILSLLVFPNLATNIEFLVLPVDFDDLDLGDGGSLNLSFDSSVKSLAILLKDSNDR